MARSEYASLTEIVLTGVAGVLFLALGVLGLIQIVRGDFTIVVRFRLGLRPTSSAFCLVALGAFAGTACILRAVDLWRFRHRRKR